MKRFWGSVAFGVLSAALGVGLLSCVPIDPVPTPTPAMPETRGLYNPPVGASIATLDDIADLRASTPMTVTDLTLNGTCDGCGRGPGASGLFATVGGGSGNTASDEYATVGGGASNTASGSSATVGGGASNTASGSSATVGGGTSNTASGSGATVGGGTSNTASDEDATVGGGWGNTANYPSATVGGGSINTASGNAATVGGGSINTASGNAATVGGGMSNTASGLYATVGGGNGAVASHQAEDAYAAGVFAAAGDAQRSDFVARLHITAPISGTWYTLWNGGCAMLTLPVGSVWLVRTDIVGATTGSAQTWGYEVVCLASNAGGTLTVAGATTTVVAEADAAYDARCSADETNDAVAIEVRRAGGTEYAIRWVASIRATQVSW